MSQQTWGKEQRGGFSLDDSYPYPFTSESFEKSLKEVPDGARLAIQTCLQHWREKKFGTDSFLAFLGIYAGQSKSLSMILGEESCSTGHVSDTLSSPSDAPSGSLSSVAPDDAASRRGVRVKQEPGGGSDSDKGSTEKGYMGSASGTSDSHGQSSNGHSSNGGESNSSNGNGSSNGGSGCGSSQGTGSGSGSESAGKDNSPTNDLDECEEGDQVLSELPRSSNRKRPHTPSQVKGKRGSALSKADAKRARQDQTAALSALSAFSPSVSFQPIGHGGHSNAEAPAQSYSYSSSTDSIKGHMYHHPTLDTKRTDEAQGAIYEIAGQQPDNRWFPGMSMDSDGEVVGVPGLRGGAGGESRWSMGVAGTDLGDALTANIQAMGLGTPVVVKVMSCTRSFSSVPASAVEAPWSHAPPASDPTQTAGAASGGAMVKVPFLKKFIAAFQNIGGADVVIFGMYVHEYAVDAAPRYAARAYVECLDSPPVWAGLSGIDRQRCATSIMHTYCAFIASRGFRFIHLLVPPPDDPDYYIFAPRSVPFRLRLNIHLLAWFNRVLETAQGMGVITDQRQSHRQEDAQFPPGMIPRSLFEEGLDGATTNAAVNTALLVEGVGSKNWQYTHGCFTQTFMVAALAQRGYVQPVHEDPDKGQPVPPCPAVANRTDCIKFLKDQSLNFGTLAHAQYASMVLCHTVRNEQLARSGGSVAGSDSKASKGPKGSSPKTKYSKSHSGGNSG